MQLSLVRRTRGRERRIDKAGRGTTPHGPDCYTCSGSGSCSRSPSRHCWPRCYASVPRHCLRTPPPESQTTRQFPFKGPLPKQQRQRHGDGDGPGAKRRARLDRVETAHRPLEGNEARSLASRCHPRRLRLAQHTLHPPGPTPPGQCLRAVVSFRAAPHVSYRSFPSACLRLTGRGTRQIFRGEEQRLHKVPDSVLATVPAAPASPLRHLVIVRPDLASVSPPRTRLRSSGVPANIPPSAGTHRFPATPSGPAPMPPSPRGTGTGSSNRCRKAVRSAPTLNTLSRGEGANPPR